MVRMRKMLAVSVAVAAVLAVGALPGNAGETHTSKGTAVYVQSGEPYELSNGQAVVQQVSKGFVLADDPTDPLHMSSQNCVGTSLVTAEGMPGKGYGYCDGVDAEGHMWWIWWSSEGRAGKWGFMGGTGPFEGVTGGGTTTVTAVWPEEGKYAIAWDGSWETK